MGRLCKCTSRLSAGLTGFLLSLLVTALTIFLFVWFNGGDGQEKSFWSVPSVSRLNHTTCENITNGFFRQPISGFSSLSFFFVGAYIFCCGLFDWLARRSGEPLYGKAVDQQEAEILLDQYPGSDSDEATEAAQHRMLQEIDDLDQNQNVIIQHPPTSFVYGLVIIFLAVSSEMFYACECELALRFFVSGVIGVASLPFLFQLILLVPTCCKACSSHYVLLPLLLIITALSLSLPEVLNHFPVEELYLNAGLAVILLLDLLLLGVTIFRLTRSHVVHKKFAVISVLLAVVAAGIWIPEGVMGRCLIPTTSAVQPLRGLALILFSLSLLFLYIFFRSLSFLHARDSFLWRPAVLLRHKDDSSKKRSDVDYSFSEIKFDL